MWKVRELADKVTNVVMNYTEIESKVREATNDDPWGPTGTIKHELSQATFSYDQFPEVMGMLWKRIAENKRSPRRIYKSLLLLHHLLLHGSERVVRAAQDRLYEVRSLQDYHVVYEPGFNFDAIIPPSGSETKDGELNVRVKAKELVELIQDEERLREERKKAKKNRDKYVGIGSDKMMTSKWSDNDFGGGYDDEYGRKSRSPSPPTKDRSKKPYSDSEADLKRSPNSFSSGSNRSFTSKPAPPSPGVEVSDDFDPRSDEKVADFGDFTSAPTNAATSSFKIGTPKESGGDFADFQSAFGDSPPVSIGNSAAVLNGVPPSSSTTSVPAATAAKADDLLGLSFDIGGSSAATSSSNASLLTDSLFSNSAAQQPNFPVTNSVAFPNLAGAAVTSPPLQSPTMQFQAAFPSMGSGGFSPMSTPAVPSQPQSLPISQPFSSLSGNFGGDLMTPILEPAKPSANGSIANNSNNNNNNSAKPSLQGTTWSDLNISIDDLNLGRDNGRNGTANKTPMNQLKASNTANSFGGLGGFP